MAVILVITTASHYFGLWGVILGPPLLALGKDIIIYFVQQWSNPYSVPAAAGLPAPSEAAQLDEAPVAEAAEGND